MTGYGSVGTYQLAVTAQPYVDDYAGDATTSGQIAAGETRAGEIGHWFDRDWFRTSLTEGETYEISLRGGDSGSGTLPDPYVILRYADGNEIAADDDGSGTLDSLLVFTAEASGDYFIDAGELASGTGTYVLSVELLMT